MCVRGDWPVGRRPRAGKWACQGGVLLTVRSPWEYLCDLLSDIQTWKFRENCTDVYLDSHKSEICMKIFVELYPGNKSTSTSLCAAVSGTVISTLLDANFNPHPNQ